MGYGRYVVVRGLNALLVLFIAILITVSVFSVLERVQYEEEARQKLMLEMMGTRIPPAYEYPPPISKAFDTPVNGSLKDLFSIETAKIDRINVTIVNINCPSLNISLLTYAKKELYYNTTINSGSNKTVHPKNIIDIIIVESPQPGCRVNITVKYRKDITDQKLQEIMKKRWDAYVKQYGLDVPLYIKVFSWVYRSLILDFGDARESYPAYGNTKNVRALILTALARTALLFTTAEIIALIIGILLGLLAAYKRGGIFDRFLSVFALTTNSIPMYWLGMILILFFSYTLGIFPPRSWEYVPEHVKANTSALIAWYLHHMALPLITIVFVAFGGIAWYARNIALSTFQEDFIMVAWAKGLPEKTVLYKHVLRAISPPIVTMSLFSVVSSFFGAIISEVVFQWPGMGRLYYSALSNTDTPVVLGVTYLTIMVTVLTKYILDLIYGFLDPRIKTA